MWPEQKITSWEEILRILEILPKRELGKCSEKSDYIFRGQADVGWHLVPSLTRLLKEIDPEIAAVEAEQIEVALLNNFKKNADLYFSQDILKTRVNPAARWSLMQHHGSPTRLLDWTNNLLVAVFFAVNSHPGENGAIWIVHSKFVNDGSRQKLHSQPATYQMLRSGMAQPVVQIWMEEEGAHIERVVAQDGLFTLCHQIFGSQQDLIEEVCRPEFNRCGEDGPEVFRKVVVPKELKPVFQKELEVMGVQPKLLFPGDDELGKSLRELAQKMAEGNNHARYAGHAMHIIFHKNYGMW
jgi:hypothetical protein